MTALPDKPVGAGDTARFPPQPGARRPLNVSRLWAGGVATAVVAALIALVGVLVVRTVFRVAGYDTSGVAVDGSTVVLCLVAAFAALAATGLAHLLLNTTPRPLTYLSWIVGLATAVAVAMPLVTEDSIVLALAKAVVHLLIGTTIGMLIITAARASRPYLPAPPMR